MSVEAMLLAVWACIVSVVKSSPAQVVTATIAAASFYRAFLQRPRLQILPADSIRVILGTGEGITALHVMCTLVNHGARTGILQRLEAEITPPEKPVDIFVWREFYRYLEGGQGLQKEADPHPVALGPRESKVLFVEFGPPDGKHRFDWTAGRYEVCLRGWVSKAGRRKKSNLATTFHFAVPAMAATEFHDTFHHQPTARVFPVSEWQSREVDDPLAAIGRGA